jgi:hypothetical protein
MQFGTAYLRDADYPQLTSESWHLQAICHAVDSHDLRAGRWGICTAVAGGTNGVFEDRGPDDYIVLMTPPAGSEALYESSATVSATQIAQGQRFRLESFIRAFRDRMLRPGQQPSARWAKSPSEFTIGTRPVSGAPVRQREGLFRELHGMIAPIARMQALTGSPISGAVSSCLPHLGIDLYLALVSSTQATLLAAAASCTGAGFIGLNCGTGTKESDGGRDFVGTDFFVRKNSDVFLVATGVTEHPLLQGVRFKGDRMVTTQTMCLRSYTRSTRYLTHHHQLDEKRFRLRGYADSGRARRRDEVRTLSYHELQREIEELITPAWRRRQPPPSGGSVRT